MNKRKIKALKKLQSEAVQTIEQTKAVPVPHVKSLQIVQSGGAGTMEGMAALMLAVVEDTLAGRISPAIGNTAINGAGKVMKAVDLIHKHGSIAVGATRRDLAITGNN